MFNEATSYLQITRKDYDILDVLTAVGGIYVSLSNIGNIFSILGI